MNNNRVVAGFSILLIACVAAIVWLYNSMQLVQAENARLKITVAEHHSDAQTQTDETAVAAAELERLRASEHELLKLRGDNALMRRQLAEAHDLAKQASVTLTRTNPTAAKLPSLKPFTTATVPSGHSVVTGGWPAAEGAKTFAFVSPTILDAKGNQNPKGEQVVIENRLITIPDTVLQELDLQALFEKSVRNPLTDVQTRTLLKQLQEIEGVNVVAAPRVITMSGRQAQVSVLNSTPNGASGPMVDVVPVVVENSSVLLTLFAQYRSQ